MDSPQPPSKAPIEATLRARRDRIRRLPDHPAAAELVAYHERRLSEPEAERLRDHVALCPDCAGLLLDLAAFSEPEPPEGSGLTTPEVEAAWRELAPRLAATHLDAGSARPRRASVLLPWALAASLLLAVIGLSAWVTVVRQELRASSRPRADAVLANLEPNGEDATRGETDAAPERPRADRPAMLLLHSATTAHSYAKYELQILEEQPRGRVLWRLGGLHPRELGVFPVNLPAGALRPGQYRLRLYGVAAGRGEPLADYHLDLAGD